MTFLTWADAALGVLLLVSPLMLGSFGLGLETAEQIIPGAFLVATAAWILVMHRNRLRVTWLQALDGLWLIVGSFVLLFSGLPRAATGLLTIGLTVFALSLIAAWKLTRQPATIV